MKLVPSRLSNKLALQMLKLDKESPKLLFGIGVASMVGSTVLACHATLKLEEVLEKTQSDLEAANTLEHRDYSEQDRQKDKTIIYTRSVVEIAKLYGPSVILGVAGITMLTKSHNILQERNAALTAAYVALDKGFKEYRARVVEKYGPSEDEEFRYGVERVQLQDAESGRKKTVARAPKGEPSIYARFFDETATEWERNPDYNRTFLRCQQNYANHLLQTRGYVFLNEVYKSLGMAQSTAGSIVGWMIGNGDDYISFGIFDDHSNEKLRDFVNGHEGSVLLDFNVDGVIYQLIDDQVKQRAMERGNRT